MATDDANQPRLGRQLSLQVVHTLRAAIDYTMEAGGVVGTLPEDAVVHDCHVMVTTGFDDTTGDDIDVGVQGGTDNVFASAVDANAVAYTSGTIAAANRHSADERVVSWNFTTAATGDGTAGEAFIILLYSVNNG